MGDGRHEMPVCLERLRSAVVVYLCAKKRAYSYSHSYSDATNIA